MVDNILIVVLLAITPVVVIFWVLGFQFMPILGG